MQDICIVVPVYNAEAYLPRCLESIGVQEEAGWEVWLSDDGSPDDSAAQCDAWAVTDARGMVCHTLNGGQAIARNQVLELSCSPYIAFVDSDDWVSAHFLCTLYRAIRDVPADIAICRFASVSPTASPNVFPTPLSGIRTLTGKELVRDCLMNGKGLHWLLWDKLFRRDCWTGIRLPEGRIHEDNATVYRILWNTRTVADTGAVLYAYVENRDSTVHRRFTRKTLDYLRVWDEMVDFFRQKGEEALKNQCRIGRFHALAELYGKARRAGIPDGSVIRELKLRIKTEKNALRDLYPVTLAGCPVYAQHVHPILTWWYWTIRGIYHKFIR